MVRAETQDRVARIELARLDKKNAITTEMYVQLAEALAAADADSEVRAVLLHGAKDCFTAGNDLSDFLKRPIVVAVKKPGQEVSREELLKFYEGKIAKWWLPDDVVFVPELPHTATGKLSKLTLRQRMKDYKLGTG